MCEYYMGERASGHTPTGAELDRAAGRHNYGLRILRKWKAEQNRRSGSFGHVAAVGAVTSAREVVSSVPAS